MSGTTVSMTTIEFCLFWATMFCYLLSFSVHLFSFMRQEPGGVTWAIRLLRVGFVLHTAAGVTRWILGGHPPVTDTFELNLTGVRFLVLLFLLFERQGKLERAAALIIAPLAFLILGHGYVSHSEPEPMSAAYQSPWLWFHVIPSRLAFGCYAIATGAGIMLIARKRDGETEVAAALDLTSYRFIVLGFINHAVMLIAGAIWARNLWGRYWSWDALETWSLIAFLYYAFYLHARSFLNWRMVRAAWLTVIGLVVLAVSFWGVDIFAPSAHPGP